MTEIGGYSLHLYCDVPGCRCDLHPVGQGHAIPGDFYHHKSKRGAWFMARLSGWAIRAGKVSCPFHRRALKRKASR